MWLQAFQAQVVADLLLMVTNVEVVERLPSPPVIGFKCGRCSCSVTFSYALPGETYLRTSRRGQVMLAATIPLVANPGHVGVILAKLELE